LHQERQENVIRLRSSPPIEIFSPAQRASRQSHRKRAHLGFEKFVKVAALVDLRVQNDLARRRVCESRGLVEESPGQVLPSWAFSPQATACRVKWLSRRQGYHWQLADRLKLFCHRDVFVFSADARCLVAGDRIRNPLGYNRGRVAAISGNAETNGSYSISVCCPFSTWGPGSVLKHNLEGLTAVGVAGDAGQAVLAQLMSLSLRSGRIDVRSGEHDDHANAAAVWLCRPPASPESSRPAPRDRRLGSGIAPFELVALKFYCQCQVRGGI
jgi:hypothetical protein